MVTCWAASLQPSNHPYLNGAWTPLHEEVNATDLEVIEGTIPTDIDGIYLRNTENQLHQPLGRHHPFDGDGMIHQISFANGSATYRNRFIRTRTGSDITYMRFAFTGELGQHHAHRVLDQGIVRAVWLSLEELQATAHLHRSPVVLQSVRDYLAATGVAASRLETAGFGPTRPVASNGTARGRALNRRTEFRIVAW